MKILVFIHLLLCCWLLAGSNGALRACNVKGDVVKNGCCGNPKQVCCSISNHPKHRTDFNRHAAPDSDCSDENDCRDCPCPGCGVRGVSTPYIPSDLHLSLLLVQHVRLNRAAYYYSDHLPKPVYLPIWHPPQWRQ